MTWGASATTHRTLARMSDFEWPVERAGPEQATSRWWLYLALGAVSAWSGCCCCSTCSAARTVALLAALGLVLTGASELVAAGRYRSVLGIVAGAVLVAGGLAAAAWPDITLWALAVVAGIGLVVSGVARIMGALSLRVEGWVWLLVGGAISVVVGIALCVAGRRSALGVLLGCGWSCSACRR